MPGPRTSIKFVYLLSWLAMFGAAFVMGLVQGLADSMGERDLAELAALAGTALLVPVVLTWLGSALFWIYDAWSSVPPEYREAPLVGRVEPALAVLFFFIPCFNLVWIFLCNLGLADSTNRALAMRGSSTQVSVPLVAAACIFQLLPYCNVLFGPPLWFLVMLQVDKARAELGSMDVDALAAQF